MCGNLTFWAHGIRVRKTFETLNKMAVIPINMLKRKAVASMVLTLTRLEVGGGKEENKRVDKENKNVDIDIFRELQIKDFTSYNKMTRMEQKHSWKF